MNRSVKLFLTFAALFVATLAVLLLCFDKAELHLLLTRGWVDGLSANALKVSDFLFRCLTEIGASVPFVVAAVLLFKRYADALLVLAAQGVAAFVVYPIKVWVAALRPSAYFATFFPDVTLHTVDGVTLHAINSFPSGHTAAAFALMLCLTIIYDNKTWLAPLFALLAMLAGYSRIYLSQHFALDVCVGAVVGVLATLVVAHFLSKWHAFCLQKSVLDLFRKK